MRIEEEIFQKRKAKKESLLPYGFLADGETYVYHKVFFNGMFEAVVSIDSEGVVSGKVIDTESKDEYVQVHLSSVGGYAHEVREAYKEILKGIADNCFEKEYFLTRQMNRITGLVKEKYGESPDFPFRNIPDYGVFRLEENRKWYGLVMQIPESKMFEQGSDQIIEILNIKSSPEKKKMYLDVEGIYPAYQMNKDNWLTVVMDDAVDDELILQMVDESRKLVKDISRRSSSVSNEWIVPANPKYYDLKKLFHQKKGVIWKQGSRIKKGDIVYMYIASPVSAVKYKCLVTEADIPYEYHDKNVSMKKIMKMDVLERYGDDICPFSKLNELGIAAVRGQRTVTKEFSEYMNQQ